MSNHINRCSELTFTRFRVSDGALSSYFDRCVKIRVSKVTFGSSVYDSSDPEHVKCEGSALYLTV